MMEMFTSLALLLHQSGTYSNDITESYEPELGTSLYDTFNDPTGHADLPPAYLQASGSDILRDDSIIYERVLREDYKVPTRIDIYKGMPHMFWVFFPTFTTTLQWKEDIVNGVRWLLQQKK
jgi:acetyl esterase/lipase